METNTAAIGVEDGIGKQVIQVHKHGGYENEPDLFPTITVEYPSDDSGKYEMHTVMNDRLEKFGH